MTETKATTVANARLMLVKMWRATGYNADVFCSKIKKGELENPGTSVVRKFSAPSLFRWEQNYRKGGVEALQPTIREKKGAGSFKLSDEDKNLIQAYYLKQQRPQLKKVIRDINKIHDRNIPYQTALRYVKQLPEALIAKYRYGSKRLNDRQLPYIQRDFELYDSMQEVTSDHHHLDMYVYDDEFPDEDHIFRPWITVFQDIRSRKIVGWYLCRNPNGYTILQAMRNMIDNFGCPENIHIDNGKDYKSRALNGKVETVSFMEDGLEQERQIVIAGVFHDIGCNVSFAQPYHGQAKPVERWFRELAEGFCKKYDTYCGSNTVERPEDAKLYFANIQKMGKKKVEVSFSKVKYQIDNWINNWNATHSHSGHGMNGKTPDAVFEENWKIKRILPKEKYEFVFSETRLKHVSRCSVVWDGLRYVDGELGMYNGQKILVRRPLEDISYVYCTTIEGKFICRIESDRLRSTKVSSEAIKEVRKEQRKIKQDLAKASRIQNSGVNVSDQYDMLLNIEKVQTAIKQPKEQVLVGEHLRTETRIRKPISYDEIVKKNKKEQAIIGLLD